MAVCLILTLLPATALAADGPFTVGEDSYPTLEAAAEAADDGETIVIAGGGYDIGTTTINKAVNIEGAGAGETVLIGNLKIAGSSVDDVSTTDKTITVSGITLEAADAASNNWGLYFGNGYANSTTWLNGWNIAVTDCAFEGWQFAVCLQGGTVNGATMSDNTLTVTNSTFTDVFCATSVDANVGQLNAQNSDFEAAGEHLYVNQTYGGGGGTDNLYYSTVDGVANNTPAVSITTGMQGDFAGNTGFDVAVLGANGTPKSYAGTIEDALKKAEDGDTLYLSAGEYEIGSITLFEAISIQGAGAEETTIRGQVIYGNGAWNGTGNTINWSDVKLVPADSDNQALCLSNHVSGYALNVTNCVFDGWRFGIGINAGASNNTLNVTNTSFEDTWCAMGIKVSDGNQLGTMSGVTTTAGNFAVQKFGYAADEPNSNSYYNTVDDAIANQNPVTDITSTPSSWEAKDNKGNYGTLAELVEKAQDTGEAVTITLLDDVTLTASISLEAGDNININGNGNTISVSESFSGGDVITVYADDTTIQNVIIDGKNKSDYGIQFYKAANGRVENVTAQNNNKRGIHVNASTVTAAGKIELSNNGWGDSINVGFGSSISDAPGASLNVTNATLVGVVSIYADDGDVERAGTAGKVITVTDGNNNYVAVGDRTEPVLFVPKDTVEDTAVITVMAPDGTPTYYEKNASLKEAIENAPEGSTVTLAKDTAFTITSAIEVDKDITIDGNGNTITADNCAGIQIVDDLESLEIRNLTVKGVTTPPVSETLNNEPFMGIGTYNDCYGVADLKLTDVTVEAFTFGLYFGNNEANDAALSVTADNLTVQDCYVKGAYFEKLTDSTFTDCKFLRNGDNVADVNPAQSWLVDWMCGVDINLKNGNYKNIEFVDCTFTGNGANKGTALHIKARDDGSYGSDTTLDGVTVTGCTFQKNNAAVEAPIVLGEPGKNNKTPVNVYIQPDVDYVDNLDQGSVVTVTFNSNGGDPIPSQVVAKGTEIPLPGCTHSSYHYKFDGWKCGNATYYAGDEVKVNSDMTFTAQWKERFPDGPSSGGSSSVSDNEYAVTVDAGKHGDVSVSPKWAEEGDTVTITADPDNGYVVDEVIVTDKNGDDIRVRDRGDGEYTFTMPDSKVTVEVTFVEEGDELSFVDVAKSDYYYDAVKWAVENGVTTGVTDTIFAPGNPCTRAQTVTFLWRAAGMPQAANRVNPFTDVSINDYYYEAVLWAVENGITGGTTATTFSPNATCTRAQVVTFLWRYSKEDASILPMFTDVAEGDYYYGAVAWAVENGVTTGVTDTSFVPGNPCTRGQIVTFLYRYMGK